MLVICPTCQRQFDDLFRECNCPKHRTLDGGHPLPPLGAKPELPHKEIDEKNKALDEIARLMNLHFDGWLMVVEVVNENGDASQPAVRWHGGISRAMGLVDIAQIETRMIYTSVRQ